MAKVVQFSGSMPERLGLQKVRHGARPQRKKGDPAQLSLFTGRVVSIHQRSTFEEALAADEAGQTEQARQLYQQAIASHNHAADAWCNLGIIEHAEGNLLKAITAFSHCLSIDPLHFEAHYNLANCYAEAQNYNLAELHYRMAIELGPDFPNSYFNLGLTLALKRQYTEAIHYLTHYCRLTPPAEQQQANSILEHLKILAG
jgi:tetratricopeptide (TPR) repeat protein